MSTAVWDSDTILQITDASGRGMFCVGLARPHFNSPCRSRCRWNVPPDRYFAVLSLLGAISMKLPHDVANSELRRISQLGLCKYHVDQEDEVVSKWENILGCLACINRTYEGRREENFPKLEVLLKEENECRSLLGVKEDCNDALSLVLGRHINTNALLSMELVASKATCTRLQKDQAGAKNQKEENSRLSAENSRLSTLLKRAEEAHEPWQNQESILSAECEKLRKQNAALQADINAGKDKYKDLQDREQSATMELMAATTRLHEVQSVNPDLENDKKTLQSELDILKQQAKRLDECNTSISSELASTAASLEAVTKELSAARHANMELHSKIDQLSTPVWYRWIRWIQQKLAGLKKPRKEVPDEEEGVALAPAVSVRDA